MTDAYLSGDTVKVDHLFTLKLDRSLRKTADRMLDLVSEYSESFRYIAIGLSAYLVLLGMAQVVGALGTADESSKSSKKKTSKKDKSESSSKAEAKPEAETMPAKTERKVELGPPK